MTSYSKFVFYDIIRNLKCDLDAKYIAWAHNSNLHLFAVDSF